MSIYIVTEFYIGLFLNNLCEKAPGGFWILMVLLPFQKDSQLGTQTLCYTNLLVLELGL